jgi:probable DNA metabolism protein
MTYLYDGSFEGFLTLIHQSYVQKKSAEKIIRNLQDIDLLDEVTEVVTNRTYAGKVLKSLEKKFHKRYFNRIFHIFLCDTRDFELPLYVYIVLGFRDQKNLSNINHPSIYYIEKLEQEYFRHLHKMYGFVRFEELEDKTLYAKIEGKFNLLPLLGRHFMKRLDGNDFIIHDTRRALAFLYHEGESRVEQIASFTEPRRSLHEEKFQKLWKTFFKSVMISERKNLKLQQNWVPLLYRKYMTEFQS